MFMKICVRNDGFFSSSFPLRLIWRQLGKDCVKDIAFQKCWCSLCGAWKNSVRQSSKNLVFTGENFLPHAKREREREQRHSSLWYWEVCVCDVKIRNANTEVMNACRVFRRDQQFSFEKFTPEKLLRARLSTFSSFGLVCLFYIYVPCHHHQSVSDITCISRQRKQSTHTPERTRGIEIEKVKIY